MQILHIEWKWNVPNALSLVRIALIPVFMVLFMTHHDEWSFVALALSGLTDALDGIIARRFNQITDCGKLLDPVSDKLTQVAVVVALTTRYTELLPLAVLCFVKELCQAVGGILLLRRRCTVRGSKWFGKLSTVVFYACMLAMVLFPDMNSTVAWILIALAGACMLLAFFGYLQMYIRIRRESETTEVDSTEMA
jgi:cardiolipin synthase